MHISQCQILQTLFVYDFRVGIAGPRGHFLNELFGSGLDINMRQFSSLMWTFGFRRILVCPTTYVVYILNKINQE